MVYAWHMHGICMVYAWYMHGICMAYAWHMHGMLVVAHRHAQPPLRRVLLPTVLARLGHESARPPVPCFPVVTLPVGLLSVAVRLLCVAFPAVSLAVLVALAVRIFAVRMPPTFALGVPRGRVSRGR